MEPNAVETDALTFGSITFQTNAAFRNVRTCLKGVLVLSLLVCGHSGNAQPVLEPHTFVTIAGSPSTGSSDGLGSAVRFRLGLRSGVASAGNGVLYVADTMNHTIRRILPTGEVTTVVGLAGVSGTADGAGSAARFNRPSGVAVDSQGALWVADTGNRVVRKVDKSGVVSTAPGTYFCSGIATGPSGEVWVSDFDGEVVKLDSSGNQIRSFPANQPTGIAVGANGTVFVGEYGLQVLSAFDPSGKYTILVGSRGSQGINISSLTIDRSSGNLYVVDDWSHTVQQVTASGVVTTLAGLTQNPGSADGLGRGARFSYPEGVAADEAGIYVADAGNNLIRKVTAAGVVTTLAGTPPQKSASSVDGVASGAKFADPSSLTIDHHGNLYVLDADKIRKVSSIGEVTTLPGVFGRGLAVDSGDHLYFVTTNGLNRIADGGERQLLSSSVGMGDTIAVDSAGTVYVASYSQRVIKKLDANGRPTIIAGALGQFGRNDGPGLSARFDYPSSIAVDGFGNIFVTEGTEYRYQVTQMYGLGDYSVRKIDTNNIVTTVFLGVAGNPQGVAADRFGNVFVADSDANVVFKVTPDGKVKIIGGHLDSHMHPFDLNGGIFASARHADGFGEAVEFGFLNGIAVDDFGVLYVAEGTNFDYASVTELAGNRVIRKGWPAAMAVPLAIGNPMHSDHRFGFTLTSTVGKTVRIESSLDFKNWFSVSTNSAGGVFNFIDPVETGPQPRFYRAREL